MRRALLGVAIAAVAFSGVASAQNTFCERYSTADEAASQFGLISAVVGRAVLGATAAETGSNAVTGLINEPNNKGYFNGTLSPFVDFTAGGAPFTTLATHLYQFFTLALGCRTASMNASYAWSPVQMYAKHSAMGITPTIMNAFIGEVGSSLTSFGVVLGDGGAATEFGFLGALLSQFNRYPTTPSSSTILSNGLMICTAASCPLAHQIVQFHVDDSNVITQLGAPTVTTATIAVGDYVNFRFSATGGVVETDSATGTTAKSGGIASAVGTRTYTTQMNTAGTYYFYALNNAAGTKVAITVTAAASSSASMMGSSTGSMTGPMSTGSMLSTGSMTSTGKNAASSSATLGFATVLAVAAAVAAVVA